MYQFEQLESRALLAVSIQLVDFPISAEAIAADPSLAGYRSVDLRVTFDGSPFNVAAFTAQLTRGNFYQPSGAGLTPLPAAAYQILPHFEYATSVALPGFLPVPLGLLPHQDRMPIFTGTEFHPAWGAHGVTLPSSGTYTVARFTFPLDGDGWIEGQIHLRENPGVGIRFMDSLPGGRPVGLIEGPAAQVQVGGFAAANLYYWQAYVDLNNNSELDQGEPWDWTNNEFAIVAPVGGATLRLKMQDGYTPHPTRVSDFPFKLRHGDVIQTPALSVTVPNAASMNGFVRTPQGFAMEPMIPISRGNAEVFIDRNRNGVNDTGELFRIVQAAYTFDNLPPNDYLVSLRSNVEWRAVHGVPNSAELTSPANGHVTIPTFVVINRNSAWGKVSIPNPDTRRAVVTAQVFDDVNNNGLLDTTEPFSALRPDGSFTVFCVRGNLMNLTVAPLPGYQVRAGTPSAYSISFPAAAYGVDVGEQNFELVRIAAVTRAAPRSFSQAARAIDSFDDEPEVL